MSLPALDIPEKLAEFILKSAFDKVPVDIDFAYTDNLNTPRKFKGTLHSVKHSEHVAMDTILELF